MKKLLTIVCGYVIICSIAYFISQFVFGAVFLVSTAILFVLIGVS
jgi:hypothetical protein